MNKKISSALTRTKIFLFSAETKFEFLLNILIAVLAISVLILGVLLTVRYQLWLKASLKLESFFSMEEQSIESATSPSPDTELNQPDENELLNLTSEEMGSRYQEIQAAAVEASQIVIDSCQADPAIAIVTLGQTLSIENKNNFPISLKLGEETIELAADTTQDVKPSFEYGIGTYGYFCDAQGRVESPNQNTGIFIVKE